MNERDSIIVLSKRKIYKWMEETQHINSVLAGHSANKALYVLSVLGRVYTIKYLRFIYIWVEDSVHEACR